MAVGRDETLARVRAALAGSAELAGEGPERVTTLGDELGPFVEAAHACEGVPVADPRWSEARSLALLFAYRLGDQGYAPGVVSGSMLAWRDAAGGGAAGAIDALWPLLLDGYARGREDRARATLHAAAAEAATVLEAAPRRWLVSGVGALDVEGARELARRAAAAMLRGDAEALLLDLASGPTAEPAALLELLGLEHDAASLGARFVLALSEGSRAALDAAGWRADRATEVLGSTADAMRSLLWSGDPLRSALGWVARRAGW